MVELTTGKMKSREGTVVDADDLLDEMTTAAQKQTEELGKVKDFTTEELKGLYDIIGLGAMKFYLLRVDPKKTMVFNPEESIDPSWVYRNFCTIYPCADKKYFKKRTADK